MTQETHIHLHIVLPHAGATDGVLNQMSSLQLHLPAPQAGLTSTHRWSRSSGKFVVAVGLISPGLLEHFQAKWPPVRMKKMRQNKGLEHFCDSMKRRNALTGDQLSPVHLPPLSPTIQAALSVLADEFRKGSTVAEACICAIKAAATIPVPSERLLQRTVLGKSGRFSRMLDQAAAQVNDPPPMNSADQLKLQGSPEQMEIIEARELMLSASPAEGKARVGFALSALRPVMP